jgi:hypothetical protein
MEAEPRYNDTGEVAHLAILVSTHQREVFYRTVFTVPTDPC